MSSTQIVQRSDLIAAKEVLRTESASLTLSLVRDPSPFEDRWETLRTSNPLLATGYFHPEFSRAVMRVRDDVEFAIIERAGEISAILPFQRVSPRVAHPVGGMMNDFHGVIAGPSFKIDYRNLLKQAGLSQLHFHALSFDGADPAQSIKRVFRRLDCPFIDLAEGPDAYRKWVRKHSSTVKRQPQKTRAMERDLGALKLEFDCRDAQALETLIEWKRSRFKRTRTFDILGVDWTSNLLREVFKVRHPEFRGVLSVLWAGDTMVAGHFGFICDGILHYWFPAHNHQYGKFSPGTRLMIGLTETCHEHQVHRIDLGYGESDLKTRFANGRTEVELGCLGFNPGLRWINNQRYEIRQALKKIPAKEALKKIVRPLFPNLGKGKFR